jgi:adenosylcobinamide hydrolase
MTGVAPELLTPVPDEHASALLLWRLPKPMLAISSAPLGGGVGLRGWVINAQVGTGYSRLDVEDHLREITLGLGVNGAGVGMLTAAPVDGCAAAGDGGVRSFATVGLRAPTWASAAGAGSVRAPVGTINLVALLPVCLSKAALVNAVMTVTEAKTQALLEAGVPGTGTASDAVCVLCSASGPEEGFCGPRSRWGAPLARAVHGAVARGVQGTGQCA